MVFAGLFSALVKQEAAAGTPSWQLDATISSDSNITTTNFGTISDISTDGKHIAIASIDTTNTTGYTVVYSKNANHVWSKVGQSVQHLEAADNQKEISVSISDDGQTFVTGVLDDQTVTLSNGQSLTCGFVNVWQYESSSSSWVAKGTHGTSGNPESADIFPPLTTTNGVITNGTVFLATNWGQSVQISGDGNTVAVTEKQRFIWLFDWNSSTSSWVNRQNVTSSNVIYAISIYNNGGGDRVEGTYFQFHKNGTTIACGLNYNQSRTRVLDWDSSLSRFVIRPYSSTSLWDPTQYISSGGQIRLSYDTNTWVVSPSQSSLQPIIYEWDGTYWAVKGTNGATILPYDNTASVRYYGAYPNSDGTKIVWRNKIYTYDGTSWSEDSDTPNPNSGATAGLYSIAYNDNGLFLLEDLGSNQYNVLAYDYR